ncbi:MAG TPA: hypothetical protein VFU28_14715 [Vicinamibacterales bacterium]|nr:hypothetical protein [Vicinamibacterales bacterium]
MARGPLLARHKSQLQNRKRSPGTLEFALRGVRGGKRIVMEDLAPRAVAFEPRLEAAVTKWRDLSPWKRRFVTLDDLAAEAGLTSGEFFGAVTRASFELTSQVADLIISCGYPGVVAASVRRARTPEGLADRRLIFEYVSAWRSAGACEQAIDPDRQSEAKTTSSEPLKFLRTDKDDGGTMH